MWNIAEFTLCMPGIEVTPNRFSRAVPHQLSYNYQLVNLYSKAFLPQKDV